MLSDFVDNSVPISISTCSKTSGSNHKTIWSHKTTSKINNFFISIDEHQNHNLWYTHISALIVENISVYGLHFYRKFNSTRNVCSTICVCVRDVFKNWELSTHFSKFEFFSNNFTLQKMMPLWRRDFFFLDYAKRHLS